MGGTIRETQKLIIQLVDAARPVPAARADMGMISEITTQLTGPLRISVLCVERKEDIPAEAKACNVDPNERSRRPSGAGVARPVGLEATGQSGHDDQAERHAETTNDEQRAAAEAVDDKQGWESCKEHADTDDTGGEKRDGCRSNAQAGENGGCVKDNCVDATHLTGQRYPEKPERAEEVEPPEVGGKD